MQCQAKANDPRCSQEDRARLLKMRASLLSLADTTDWLAGKPQMTTAKAL